jgi:hypothetical protein
VVQPQDEDSVIRRKLLAAAGRGNVLVRLKDGTEFIGSCTVAASDGHVLGPWFEVPTPGDENLRHELERYSKAQNWQRMLRRVERAGLAVTLRNMVRTRKKGDLVGTPQTFVRISTEEVVELKPTAEGFKDGPLSLA